VDVIEEGLRASGISLIAGVDEAGRGPCAGPLVVAAVVFEDPLDSSLNDIRDSKALSAKKREALATYIKASSLSYSIIEIWPEEIDSLGLHISNLEGMRRAIMKLSVQPDYILTDGYAISGLDAPSLAVWKGDQVSRTIGAASIVAKVHRDAIMEELDDQFPGYGFAKHKGYITRAHSESLRRLGVSPVHRRSFANISDLLK
jgi:ribonuclease HII